MQIRHAQHERLEQIQELLNEHGSVRIDELANLFAVSGMTVRRDLDELEGFGVARRVRGGAVAVGPELFAERHRHNAKAKGRIADKLRPLVPQAGAIALDASTTVHRLVNALDGARDLLVATNGMDTFAALEGKPGIAPVLTGGIREPRTGSLVGPSAVRAVGDFLFDVFITSAAALDARHGSSESSVAEADVKRAFANASGRVVLAVDHSKLDTRAQARMFGFEEIDVLVTDLDPDDTRLDPYRPSVAIR